MTAPPTEHWQAFLANQTEATFQPLYERTKGLVWTLCFRILGNEHDAHDAFQSTYLRLLVEVRAKNSALAPGTPAPAEEINHAFYRLAVREARNLVKRRQRHAHREVAMDPLPTLAAAGPGSADLAAQQQLRQQLEALLRLLPEDFRVPLQLHYFDGLSQSEIATVLEINQGSISRRLAKGIRQLQPLVRRAGLGDALTAFGVIAAACALLQPPAAYSAAVVFAQAQAAIAAGIAGAAGTSFFSAASATAKHSLWSAAKLKTAAALTSAAFIVGIGTILTLGAIQKTKAPSLPALIATSTSIPPTAPAISPGATAQAPVLVKAPQPTPHEVAQATAPEAPSAPVVVATSHTTVAAAKVTKAPTATANQVAKPPALHGPWPLAEGNPIMEGENLIAVMDADNADGDAKLIYLARGGGNVPATRFIAYDAAGSARDFVPVAMNTTPDPQGIYIFQMRLYQLAPASGGGFRVAAVAMQGGRDATRTAAAKVANAEPVTTKYPALKQPLAGLEAALASKTLSGLTAPLSGLQPQPVSRIAESETSPLQGVLVPYATLVNGKPSLLTATFMVEGASFRLVDIMLPVPDYIPTAELLAVAKQKLAATPEIAGASSTWWLRGLVHDNSYGRELDLRFKRDQLLLERRDAAGSRFYVLSTTEQQKPNFRRTQDPREVEGMNWAEGTPGYQAYDGPALAGAAQ